MSQEITYNQLNYVLYRKCWSSSTIDPWASVEVKATYCPYTGWDKQGITFLKYLTTFVLLECCRLLFMLCLSHDGCWLRNLSFVDWSPFLFSPMHYTQFFFKYITRFSALFFPCLTVSYCHRCVCVYFLFNFSHISSSFEPSRCCPMIN